MPSSVRRSLEVLPLALVVCLAAGCQQPPDLAPGQVWGYDTRPREGASTVVILHIERGTPVGDVYFVSVRALNARNDGARVRSTEVWPLVFTHDALKRSLTSYQWSEKVSRPYLKHLDLWLREAREGRAAQRTFAIPVKDALEQIDLNRPGVDKRLFSELA